MSAIKFKKIENLAKRLFFSVVVSLIILFILLLSTNKYHLVLLSKETSYSKEKFYYHDFDKDGTSEKVFLVEDNFGMVGIIISTELGIINHWNFKGEWARIVDPFIGDLSKDKKDEFFVFTYINDSLFLHCIDPIANKIVFENKAVSKVNKHNGLNDFELFTGGFYDVDKDGFNEMFFTINTGYSIQPRNCFYYNYALDSVFKSPESCAPLFFPEFIDIDQDSVPEILFETYAYGNCAFESSFSDQYSWLMVLKSDLTFKFEPLKMNVFPSSLKVKQIGEQEKFLVALSQYDGAEKYESYLALINKNGKLIKKVLVDKPLLSNALDIYSDPLDENSFYLMTNEGNVFKGDTSLIIKDYAIMDKFDNSFMNYYYKLDIDSDGEKEYIFPGSNQYQFVIVRQDFRSSLTVELDEPLGWGWFSVKESTTKRTELSVDTDEFAYLFSYSKTFVYRYWYFVFLLIELGILILYFVVKKIKDYQRLKLNETQKKITELQLKSFHNHLEPHFTFNILEAYGNLINEQNTEKAKFIFNNYSKLLKAVILNSDKVFVTLAEELDFVKSYLDLEIYRNKNKFSAEIDFPEEAKKSIILPKMLIQIFVENAIKHGLRHLKTDGLIRIKGIRRNSAFIIQIEDNGIGRRKAKQYAGYSTGKGLEIVNEILNLYNKLYASSIVYKITDLKDNESGTVVTLKIKTNTFSYGKFKNKLHHYRRRR